MEGPLTERAERTIMGAAILGQVILRTEETSPGRSAETADVEEANGAGAPFMPEVTTKTRRLAL